MPLFSRLLFVVALVLSSLSISHAGPSPLPSPPLRTAFGSRCAKSPIPCNRIDYFTAHFHIADVILLPATDSRGFAATVGYGASMSLFHRVEVGVGGSLSVWTPHGSGVTFQNGPALLNVKGILFPLLRNPVPDSEFTFGLQLQQQLRIPRFDGLNDLGTETPLTVLRGVVDKPFWRMGITASLGFLLTQGRTDSELSTAVRFHLPWMSRATVQGFGVLQGLFGSKQSAPLRGGFGLSVHFAWDNGTSLSGGYLHGRGDGIAPSAIYIGGPDYHIGRETESQSYSRPPIPNREMVPSPWPWIWEKLKQEWNEAELANEAHRRGEDWLTDECFLYEEGKYDRPLRHLGKRDASGKFCDVGGQLVPMDEPLHEVGPNLVPTRNPIHSPESSNLPPKQTAPLEQSAPTPSTPSAQPVRPKKRKQQATERTLAQPSDPAPSINPTESAPVATPKPTTQTTEPSFRESAKEFASGFGKGVRDEGERIYRDAKELPQRIAKTGRELVEDVKEGRKLRALAPIEAIGHALRTASRDDVERLAHGVVEGARDFYHKPAREKGESIGRATMSIASEAALGALTEGIGAVAGLRKAEKAADVAEHVRDAERAAASAMHKPSLERTSRGKNHLVPDPSAEGSHTTFRRNQDGAISNFTEWKDNPRNPSGFDEVKRVDMTGGSHWNSQLKQDVSTPHVHDKNALGGVRSARADEIPTRLKQGK
ncbi:MAG: hypothetical protein JNM40_00975 [Myxococcales bacterium]|nr:hypothetical protein [Myxococcales bacterium]